MIGVDEAFMQLLMVMREVGVIPNNRLEKKSGGCLIL